MSGGALRRASGLLLGRLGGSTAPGSVLGSSSTSSGRVGALAQQQQQQQVRANHDLSVHPNKHVEAWLARREDIDGEFVWNRSTVTHVLVGIVLIPTLIYNGIVRQAHRDDDYGGRPRRCVCGVL
jgi:hypothetical protein